MAFEFGKPRKQVNKRRVPGKQVKSTKRPVLDRVRVLERRFQRSELLPASDRVRWLIDSLSFASGRVTMTPEHIAERCNCELRIVWKVFREDVAAKWYEKTGKWTYSRVQPMNQRGAYETTRVGDIRGSTVVALLRVVLRLASTSGTAVLSDRQMMQRLRVTVKPLRVARKILKKLGFVIVEGDGRGHQTTYWHPELAAEAKGKPDKTDEDKFRLMIAHREQTRTALAVKAAKAEEFKKKMDVAKEELPRYWREMTLIPEDMVAACDRIAMSEHLRAFVQCHVDGKWEYLAWLPRVPQQDRREFILDVDHFHAGGILDGYMDRTWRQRLAD
jgi:hypothetical protein